MVRRDLDSAVTGLLQAYRDATPDAVIKYMSDRGKIVDPGLRKRVEQAARRRAERAKRKGVEPTEVQEPAIELEKLTDEGVYRRIWNESKSNAHWSGLVADSSCRQFWDGKNVPFNRVRSLNQNFVTGALTKPMEQADYLVHLLRGVMSGQHNFVSTAGSLEDAHTSGAQVLLCDVQLIIELDESFSHDKIPYLVRFWFNDSLQKWQPISKLCFTSSPKGGRLPSMPF
jgi:hypothetical protein